ncbi:hypothetical protein GQ42DRAFT_159746 [Ramicandelaber brevisporus]|nr:hypothetical protein GQ42DRAFT_159746 [Ramicandelaber brevisporus]
MPRRKLVGRGGGCRRELLVAKLEGVVLCNLCIAAALPVPVPVSVPVSVPVPVPVTAAVPAAAVPAVATAAAALDAFAARFCCCRLGAISCGRAGQTVEFAVRDLGEKGIRGCAKSDSPRALRPVSPR